MSAIERKALQRNSKVLNRPLAAFLLCCCAFAAHGSEFKAERGRLIGDIAAQGVPAGTAADRSAFGPAVLAAMEKVERHRFVPAELVAQAYQNRPLPIGHGQTISQPYIVALMTDLMKVGPGDRVLEIGTGSGYQAAVLAELAGSVFSVEIIEPLGRQAGERLAALGYRNVTARVGDGYHGWPDAAPFDAIMVTAAASHVPPPLLQQLKPGGRMVIPLGSRFMTQSLMLVEKNPDGTVSSRQILPVRFVPLTGRH